VKARVGLVEEIDLLAHLSAWQQQEQMTLIGGIGSQYAGIQIVGQHKFALLEDHKRALFVGLS
jgi:hypothetical protein